MRVLIAAGGTGGHIFPALAVAEELRARASKRGAGETDCAIHFIGTARGLESRLIQKAGFPFTAISAAGLKGIRGWRKVRNLLVLPRSALETASVLRVFQPRVVVGMGGYVAGPAMLEAALEGIPTLLMEPNAAPGFTNRALGPVVTLAAVGFEKAAEHYGAKARVTGYPVRRGFFDVATRKPGGPPAVLVFGGSQGSAAINRRVIESLPLFAAAEWPCGFIHQTGERDFDEVRAAYEKHRLRAEICAFIENMAEAFARADLVVCRAGASTLAELAAAGKAAILIPFPGATDQHQLENARAFESAGAARVIEERELTPERLAREVMDLLSQPDRLRAMAIAARSLARPDAAGRIANLIEELACRP
ncbi:MAG TPA: undecaprenyldiphospho-muramoylpentapeptide beta-N-acetylglucosaminyltransferase [Terriglobia bacterium]|nr:undecaprenyldiphospho-muramoylpentapeptide beta-N-acetylglucosaminyltransferase [Terriglobia bacterium]